MPAVFVPGAQLLPPDSLPWRFILHNEIGSSDPYIFDYHNADHGQALGLLLGYDITLVSNGLSLSDAQVNLLLQGSCFYHDAQSIGEGGGIDFAWRGQLPMYVNDTLRLLIQNYDESATVAFTAWGVVGPWVQSP